MNDEIYKTDRDQIRQALIDGRSSHVIVKRVIVWCRKNAAKSWDTAAIIQIANILNLRLLDARALVSELHMGATIYSPGKSATKTIVKWSCNWDKKMLDIPTI